MWVEVGGGGQGGGGWQCGLGGFHLSFFFCSSVVDNHVREHCFICSKELIFLICIPHRRCMVPFVKLMCPEVDMQQRQIVIDPPEGLLDLVSKKAMGKVRY